MVRDVSGPGGFCVQTAKATYLDKVPLVIMDFQCKPSSVSAKDVTEAVFFPAPKEEDPQIRMRD